MTDAIPDDAEDAPALLKGALLAALAAAGIAHVEIDYDGEGDNGQINGATALDGQGNRVDLDRPLHPETPPLSDALDNFAWAILQEHHGGFEDNDGGYGTIRIDVAAGTVTLDHYQRWTDAHHTWTEL
jgi:hypothetical protein